MRWVLSLMGTGFRFGVKGAFSRLLPRYVHY